MTTLKTAFVLIGLFAGIAMAEPSQPMPMAGGDLSSHPCKADADKLCPGTKPGKGLGECLEQHVDQLSQACKDKWMADHPCYADRTKLCPGMKGKEALECMKKNKDKISAACKERMGHGKVRMHH